MMLQVCSVVDCQGRRGEQLNCTASIAYAGASSCIHCPNWQLGVSYSNFLQGFLTKERARQNFDGSLWPILAEENKQRKLAKRKSA